MANEYPSHGWPITASFTSADNENALIFLDYFKLLPQGGFHA